MLRRRRRKCCHCEQLYQPDPRNRWHQEFCSQAACQQASKQVSQRRWERSVLGRRYVKRPKHARRVRDWRAETPEYWKRKRQKSVALQDVLIPQPLSPTGDTPKLNRAPVEIFAAESNDLSSTGSNLDVLSPVALPDVLFTQSPAWTGLIAHLTGGALPEDIASFTRRAILLGRQIQGQSVMPRRIADANVEASHLPSAIAQSAAAVQLDRSSPGSG